jgi:hypothetical protein
MLTRPPHCREGRERSLQSIYSGTHAAERRKMSKRERPRLPKNLLETTKKLLKNVTRKSKRPPSPFTRDPFHLPTGFEIPHPHAVHTATSENPPPTHILLRTAKDGGIRQVLIPDHATEPKDPVGILICECTNPADPDPEEVNSAQLITWEELEKRNLRYPTLREKQHFVASPTIFLQDFDTDQDGSPFLVTLPEEIAATRLLTRETTSQADLTKQLNATLHRIPDDEDPTHADQIYLKLLAIPENQYEEPPTRRSQQSKIEEEDAIIVWPEADAHLADRFNEILAESNEEGYKEYIPEDIHTGALILTPYGEETRVHYSPEARTVQENRAEHPITTKNKLRIGVIRKYTKHENTHYVTDLPEGAPDHLIEMINDPNLIPKPKKKRPPTRRSRSFSHRRDNSESGRESPERPEPPCPTCGEKRPSKAHLATHLKNVQAQFERKSREKTRQKNSFGLTASSTSSDSESPSPHRRRSKSPPRKNKTRRRPASSDTDTEKPVGITEPTLIPAILSDPGVPAVYKKFFKMTARTMEGPLRYVAPHYPPHIKSIEMTLNFPDIANTEFKAWAIAYQSLEESTAMDYQQQRALKVQIQNTVRSLLKKGKKDTISALRANAPILTTHQIQDLTVQSIAEFFEYCRIYCFYSCIEWCELANFCITRATVGDEILGKIQTRLHAEPKLKRVAWAISTFLEKTIEDLLPTQIPYSAQFDILVAQHKNYLLQAVPTTDHMRQYLETHATQLMYLHPTYQKAQEKDAMGWSQTKSKDLRTSILDSLQQEIIAGTKYKQKLSTIYITTEYKNYNVVPQARVLNDLTAIIEAETTEEIYAAATTTTSRRNHQRLSVNNTTTKPRKKDKKAKEEEEDQEEETDQEEEAEPTEDDTPTLQNHPQMEAILNDHGTQTVYDTSLLILQKDMGRIIGKQGGTINQIRATSLADITITNPVQGDPYQTVLLKGTASEIEDAKYEMKKVLNRTADNPNYKSTSEHDPRCPPSHYRPGDFQPKPCYHPTHPNLYRPWAPPFSTTPPQYREPPYREPYYNPPYPYYQPHPRENPQNDNRGQLPPPLGQQPLSLDYHPPRDRVLSPRERLLQQPQDRQPRQ